MGGAKMGGAKGHTRSVKNWIVAISCRAQVGTKKQVH